MARPRRIRTLVCVAASLALLVPVGFEGLAASANAEAALSGPTSVDRPRDDEFAAFATLPPWVSSAADAGPKCDATQLPGLEPLYEGRSVSRIYDRIFAPGPRVPYLNEHVPQGLTTWANWDGRGNTLLLIGMYQPKNLSYLVGIDPRTGRHVGTVLVDESHMGGIGLIGGWLISQSKPLAGGQPSVRRHRLADLRAAMLEARNSGYMPYLPATGKPQPLRGSSFMTVAEGSLWAGRYQRSTTGRMHRYSVDDSGKLRREKGRWTVPPRTQGVLVTPRHFLFTRSDGVLAGQLRAYRRATNLPTANPIGCLFTPSLPQNLTVHRGKVFAVFESGASRFDARPEFRNRIARLHMADLDTLLRVVDPLGGK
ncbi:MAG: hypothetical protein ACT4QG_18550 [Sporichthyaceae bacterium]